MSRPAILITVLLLTLLGAAGYWLSQHLERKEIELPTGLTDEAARATLRLSLGRFTTETEVEDATHQIIAAVEAQRATTVSP